LFDLCLFGDGWPVSDLSRFKPFYRLYGRLGGHWRHSGSVQKMSPTPGFEIRTVQPVTFRYTAQTTN